MRWQRSIGLSWLAFALACGGTATRPPADEPGGDTDLGADVGRPASCSLSAQWVTRVDGRIVDEGGAGLATARAQLCVRLFPSGDLQCVWPAQADAQGDFIADVPATARCMTQAVMRVLLPGADRATLYCDVELPAGESTVVLTAPYILYQTTRATALPPEGDEQVERTVTFVDGLELDVVPARYFGSGDGYAALAARRLAGTTSGLCLPGGASAMEVFAFSPEGDVSGAPFTARWTNTQGLAAASGVDLFVLGGLSCTLGDGSHVPEGVWQSAGTGTVSGDGVTVSGVVPCLTWFGYAPR